MVDDLQMMVEIEAWFVHNLVQFSGSLDLVYANGDHTLNAIQGWEETLPTGTIDPDFRELMFEGTHNDE